MTSNWDSPYPPRTSSRYPAPGLFMNVEFGVSFSPNGEPHTAAVRYKSKNYQESEHRQQQRENARIEHQGQNHPDLQYQHYRHPSSLMPGYQQDRQFRNQDQRQHRTLGVRTRDHERGRSAPPSLTDRNQPISPVSPVSPIGSMGHIISPIQHTRSMPLQRLERPLPPLPSRFRLGEDGLPWSTEPWYRDPEPAYVTAAVVNVEQENRRREDPQRVRDLGDLQQAMMTVDSLGNDGWEPWTRNTFEERPRGPRSLGWAIRTDDYEANRTLSPGPPPYVVSQFETFVSRGGNLRPRTSG